MSSSFSLCASVAILLCVAPLADAAEPWLVFEGGKGPGAGKQVVLISGDEEYRSEEALPQLAKILSRHHGFRCTVLFAIDPATGTINPNINSNIPGLEALKTADLMIIATRFRDLPDEQMSHVVAYLQAGKPVIGLRTATHAFQPTKSRTYAKYKFDSQVPEWEGGFGRRVLGETWISHHGNHGSESTLGVIAPGGEKHPILRGIAAGSIWGPTDVYGVRLPLPGDSQPLVLGEVLDGMTPESKPVKGKKNDPRMPIAWTKSYSIESGSKGRAFTTTMGASQDFQSEGLRRLVVNACYWCVGLEDAIKPSASVALVGEYKPRRFGFNGAAKGLKPADFGEK